MLAQLDEFLTPTMKAMYKSQVELDDENRLFHYALKQVNVVAPEEVSVSWVINFIVTFPTNDKPAYLERRDQLKTWLDTYLETADPDEGVVTAHEITHLITFIESRFPSVVSWEKNLTK